MKILHPLSCLLSLVLANTPGQAAVRYPKHSTWMLESVIARGEGINLADGLLGVIQKVQHRYAWLELRIIHTYMHRDYSKKHSEQPSPNPATPERSLDGRIITVAA